MIKDFIKAFHGKCIWNRLDKTYHSDKYIVMPHVKDEYNQYAIQYLEAYLKKEKAQGAVILYQDETVPGMLEKEKISGYDIQLKKWSDRKLRNLLKFYGLYEFSRKLTIISLTIPYDTCGENLLGVKGITKRELLCYDIYRFDAIPEMG